MLKRILDFGVAVLALIFLCPLLILLAFGVRFFVGTPVFFKQTRVGLKGRRFQIIKFRTMTEHVNAAGELYPDHIRLTGFGRFLRSSSLDELPQFYNILAGEMSLVGPRPLLVEYLPLYNQRQALRHDVRPGLTGWAQVNGRNALSWQERLEMDVWYVEHRSFALDIKILGKTLVKVIKREGINSSDGISMTPFEGNDSRP